MDQADQQGNTAAPSVPIQWSEGQLVLYPADCVIAARLIDWAIHFLSMLPREAVDVQMARLRLRFTQMLSRAYSAPEGEHIFILHHGTKDYTAMDCMRHWASVDYEQDPINGWTAVGCSSRPAALSTGFSANRLGAGS